MLHTRTTTIGGCLELFPAVFEDARGRVVKSFNREQFEALGLRSDFVESYYSSSSKNVLRGLHFQLPPHAHAKLVYCTQGRVLDVALDVRSGSPTFGKYELFYLNEEAANMVYLAEGLAHGFLVLSDSATLVYATTSGYAPASDSGIRWDSAGIPWPTVVPIVSERDSRLVPLDEFVSPFAVTGS